ncbi:hypothetical protein [Brevundimonas lenta]|uniref:HTH iclR-type domain-containing protein n=1 Tax=Brevundimonas lenta TaxID=424796 RepID=A0A7W6JF28_9CAUL|nr:hypothetical protein [Brevundimonas lenta]MBB4083891.1 hypothetical protein [Brevundimonas lenta]
MTTEAQRVLPGERAKAVAALEVLLRIMRLAVDCFPDDDLETILVLLTVAAASSGSHLRDPAILASMDGGPVPDHLHKPISGRAVAQSTGLPRETVRRRIDALVSAGRLTREARGVRTSTGVITRNRNLEFSRQLIQELTSASARINRYDVS